MNWNHSQIASIEAKSGSTYVKQAIANTKIGDAKYHGKNFIRKLIPMSTVFCIIVYSLQDEGSQSDRV